MKFTECSYEPTFKEAEALSKMCGDKKGSRASGEVLRFIFDDCSENERLEPGFSVLRALSLHEQDVQHVMHVIENHSMLCEDYRVCSRKLADGVVYVYSFFVRGAHAGVNVARMEETTKVNVCVSLERTVLHLVDDDKFNELVVRAQMRWDEVLLLRVYVRYMKQILLPHDEDAAIAALLNNIDVARQVVKAFKLKFAEHYLEGSACKDHSGRVVSCIDMVRDVREKAVFTAYMDLIQATERTNYVKFMLRNDASGKDVCDIVQNYISLKINPLKLSAISIPLPKPFMAIFVYSTRFEAVHLRGGKVARGGIRWSDRYDDYRTEVLGLMKAQMMKNSIIVPVGSKGGFVVKRAGFFVNDRELLLQEGVECYKMFLRGMLDITDNIVHGKVVKPEHVVCYDGDDPYLVVAADKGTATFSDYANSVSAEYGFWLGDAFASGGSAGYDHKKMAITAKGVGVSVEHCMRRIGKKVDADEFTAVGIGDMSGDVFGNGMLLFDKMNLVAAFNHKHIFIDPTPNYKIGYAERKRLFDMPFSQWSDYNRGLISAGGGVFKRDECSVKLTQEIKKVLMMETDAVEVTPTELISAILKAPVDMLWNGGIGTYVKASFEKNSSIGDKANDAVRINGSELRCKIVAEGGNLGATQYGRVEYAKSGGLLNTDFIDNSGGVDCSDHEVNIKIGFIPILADKKITLEARNALLSRMQDEVAGLVLKDNVAQNWIISIEECVAASNLLSHVWFMHDLEQCGELNLVVEMLPDADEINNRKARNVGLTRPELAVLLAYAKISLCKKLNATDFTHDAYFTQRLLLYFPSEFRASYGAYLEGHYLRHEIICTSVVNDLVNVIGIAEFHKMMHNMDVEPIDIVRAFIVVKEGIGLDSCWNEVVNAVGELGFGMAINFLLSLQRVVVHNMRQVLLYWVGCVEWSDDIAALVIKFREQCKGCLKTSTVQQTKCKSTIAEPPCDKNGGQCGIVVQTDIDESLRLRAISGIVEDGVQVVVSAYDDFYHRSLLHMLYDIRGTHGALNEQDYNVADRFMVDSIRHEIGAVAHCIVAMSMIDRAKMKGSNDIADGCARLVGSLCANDKMIHTTEGLIVLRQYLCDALNALRSDVC